VKPKKKVRGRVLPNEAVAAEAGKVKIFRSDEDAANLREEETRA
jgi:hypothetical protein